MPHKQILGWGNQLDPKATEEQRESSSPKDMNILARLLNSWQNKINSPFLIRKTRRKLGNPNKGRNSLKNKGKEKTLEQRTPREILQGRIRNGKKGGILAKRTKPESDRKNCSETPQKKFLTLGYNKNPKNLRKNKSSPWEKPKALEEFLETPK